MKELQSMRNLIEDRFNTLTWLGQARQEPIQTKPDAQADPRGLLAGAVARGAGHLPEQIWAPRPRWLMEVLGATQDRRADAWSPGTRRAASTPWWRHRRGARPPPRPSWRACAAIHGPGSVGLITLDTYRVGAHEQLRSYGRMLGVVAHPGA